MCGGRGVCDFILGAYFVYPCGPGVQERAKGWVYRFGCHKNGISGKMYGKVAFQIYILRGKSFEL